MKRSLLNIALVLLLLLLTPMLVFASDVSNALYSAQVIVSNNSTATTNVATVANISTENLITHQYLNNTANNTVVRNSSGADVPFQPGFTDASLWSMFVPSIGDNSYLTYILYTANSTGGKIRYFPGATGMTTTDSASLELYGNTTNFTIAQSGWIDTTDGYGKDLFDKPGAIKGYISADEEITAAVYEDGTTFPTVESTTGGGTVADDTSHTVNMPAGVEQGNLIIVMFAADGNPTITFPDAWTELYQTTSAATVTYGAWYLIAGITDNVSITVTTSAAEMVAYNAYRISGYFGVPEESDGTSAANLNWDCPNLAPSWGSQYVLWLATVGYDDGTTTVNGYPAGYAGGVNNRGNNANGVGVGSAQRNLEAAAENPGIGTLNNAEVHCIATIAIRGELDVTASVTASNVDTDEHDLEVNREAEPDMSLWAADVNVAVNMGAGILPVKLIEEQTLTAAAASVTFSNIDTKVALWDSLVGVTSRHLVVMVNAKSPDAVAYRNLWLRFNGDTGNNYNFQRLYGENAVAVTAQTTDTVLVAGTFPGTTYADAFGGGTILVPYAFNTANNKAVLCLSGGAEAVSFASAGRWASNSAVTSISFLPQGGGNFDTGSTFTLAVVDERYLVEEDLLAAPGTIDFNGIAGDGHDLAIIGYSRGTVAAAEDELVLEVNADGAAGSYNTQRLLGTAAVTSAATANDNLIGWIPAANAIANSYGAFVGFISEYAEATNYPTYLTLNGYHETTGPTSRVGAYSGRYNAAVAALTRVEFYGSGAANLDTGSLFSLYRVPRYVISRQELTAPAATITFDNIPQEYQALQLNIYGRSSLAAINEAVEITLNADGVAANYDWQELDGAGAVVTASRNVADQTLMYIPAANEGANEFGGGVVTIPRYERIDGHKHLITLSGTQENQVILRSSRWEDTDAITRIDLDLAGANNFVAGTIVELVGLMPSVVLDIDVDGDIKGLGDGNFNINDTADDYVFIEAAAMPYMESHEITINGTLQQQIEWRYNSEFEDLSGNSHNATPSFRTASSDPNVSANMTSFQPISQAQAPGYVLGETNPFLSDISGNVTGNFTTIPGTGAFPLAGLIAAIAAASSTPAQLPLLILAAFIIIAASLSTSYAMKRLGGSGSLLIKAFIIIGLMGIFIALGDWGVDFWMLVIFAIFATATAFASKQLGWQ